MTREKKSKLFAWDFHGTLEQGVEVGFYKILKQLTKEHNLDTKIELSEVRKKYGVSVADYLRHFFPSCNTSQIKSMMARIADIQNQEHLKKYVTAAPHAIEVLIKIKEAGHRNIVLSNSHPDHINPLIEIVGMKSLIDEVFAVDRHYTHKKLDPVVEKTKILKEISRRYGLGKGQSIAIGDRATDINAGLAAGAVTYQYVRKGFPVEKTDAQFKIHDLREILREI